MNKKEVQKRVLQNGKPLGLSKFTWDRKTSTFSSSEDNLVIDFRDISGCTFTTGGGCTFTTGGDCTFTTGWDCTFTTGWDCTFTTGWDCTFTTGWHCTFTTGGDCTFTTGWHCTFTTGGDCTFTTGGYCVIIRQDIFQIIESQGNEIQICPYEIPGYLEKIDNKWYLNGDKSLGEHIIADNILSKIISKKGNVYKVINHDSDKQTYLVIDGESFSHGETLKEARNSLIYKIGNRDKSAYEGMKLSTVYTLTEAIKMYRVITGACESGVREFLNTIEKKKKKYTVKEILKLTQGQYGHNMLREYLEVSHE